MYAFQTQYIQSFLCVYKAWPTSQRVIINVIRQLILIRMLSITCRDVGQNCDCIVQGETEEELMKNAAEHAVKDHGYTEEDI